MNQPFKILLADDHTLFRDSLVGYIQRLAPQARIKALENLEQVRNELAFDSAYELIFLDWHMPGVRDVDDLVALVHQYPNHYFALMSGVVRPHQVQQIILAGFRAYLPKTLSGAEMMDAMGRILKGESFVPLDPETREPEVSYHAERTVTMPATLGQEDTTGLSTRERETIGFLLDGQTNQEIADKMGISMATVKMHLRHAFDKLGVRNRTEAAKRCRELGIVNE